MGPYLLHLFTLIAIYVTLTLALNLSVGFTGLLNLAHVAFLGIGAYVSAIFFLHFHLPFAVAFLSAGIIAACVAYLLSLPSRRVSGDYFALLTLAFTFLVNTVFLNWNSVTRGALGIAGISRPFPIRGSVGFFLFTVAIAAITWFVLNRIQRTPFGRVLGAVRDDETGAAILGKNPGRAKALALTISAFFSGLAGSLFAHYIGFIDPASFYLSELIAVFSALIIGGLGSLQGTILGVILLYVLFEPLRFLGLPPTLVGPVRQMAYSALLILVLLYRPKGLLGKVELE